MAKSTLRHCTRCERDVEAVYQYSPTLRRWLKVYLYLPAFMLLPLLPFLAGDFVVTLPLMMVYMLGIGPALTITRDPPACGPCGALLPAIARRRR